MEIEAVYKKYRHLGDMICDPLLSSDSFTLYMLKEFFESAAHDVALLHGNRVVNEVDVEIPPETLIV